MLKRFYDIADFMAIKGNTINQVKDDEWVCDLAFLVDVTGYLNELNLKLQKQVQLVPELHGHVRAFCNKLRLLVSQIRAKNCYNFPTLATHKNIPYDCYGFELKALIEQFDTRFADFQNKDSTFAIFAHPMDADINNVPETLQMELIELQVDLVLKSQFNNTALTDSYKFYLVEEKYTKLQAFSRKIICLFGSTYMCVNSFFPE
jgi:hypothetical protein